MLPSVRCCKTFRSSPEDIEPKARYDNKVRQAVIDRVLVDKLNTTTVGQALERDFLLKLSTGFLYDCLEYAVKVLSEFSGSLCVDEIHLGHRVVLLASDPVSNNPIACALVSKNDAAHMPEVLAKPGKSWVFTPDRDFRSLAAVSQSDRRSLARCKPSALRAPCDFRSERSRAQCRWRDQTNAQAQANQARTRSAKQTQSSTGQEIEEATRAS